MKIVLAHPPLDDPTLPYHSTAYLAGHLVHCGFTDVAIRDVNIEMVNWTFEEAVFSSFYEEADRRLAAFERKGSLSFAEQEEYLGIWRQRRIPYEQLQRSLAGLRDRDAFLAFDDYKTFRTGLLHYQGMLGGLSYPCDLSNFRQVSKGRFSPYNFRDLFDPGLTAKVCQVFDRFLDERLADDAQFAAADCLGLSIVYDHQMHHALHMARWAKRRWPDKQILLGGTAVSQFYKYIRDKQEMRRFFEVCDGIVVGEGETALCQIADAGQIEPGAKIHNLISYDRAADKLYLPDCIHYENVPALGRPLFRYPWDLYLAPARGINYSPTRGCYWNRCTFCDYGLNTSKPTSPWRERQVDQAVDDLRAAIGETGARYVYFAVDVMAPSYLDRLSDAITAAGLDIRWAAELRLEKVFTRDRCAKLAASGCVCVSFGMESGSQRVLDLIDKGTKVAFMGETMKNFAEAGVAVQLMAFSDFPGETADEKAQTHRFVREHDDHWSTGGIGTFLLTGTAIVAKDPGRFGVRLIEKHDIDVLRAPAYELENDARAEESKTMLTEDRDASFDEHGGIFPQTLGRPWAGGTDSLHSMVYYDFYDRRFFREHVDTVNAVPDQQLLACAVVVPGVLKDSPYDLARIVGERKQMSSYLAELAKAPREPTLKSYREWTIQRAALAACPQRSYWAMAGAKCVRIDPLVYRLLAASQTQTVLLRDLLSRLDEPEAARFLRYFKRLAAHGLIEFKLPQAAAKLAAAGRSDRARQGWTRRDSAPDSDPAPMVAAPR
jgi:anaerobic magnesium-protoporphyrin IX monomethyl ester cyclase